MPIPPRDRNGFQVAIFCALPLEAENVQSVFDVCWEDQNIHYGKAVGDQNSYTTGVIEEHNVVLVHMPSMGGNSAALAAANTRSSFPRVRLAVVVGVCGVVPIHPKTKKRIVLGDVIISTAVIQYDLGRQFPDGFRRKKEVDDSLGQANPETRSFLNKLATRQNLQRFHRKLGELLASIQLQNEVDAVIYPGAIHDRLYKASYLHRHQSNVTCDECLVDVGTCSRNCDELQCKDSELDLRDTIIRHDAQCVAGAVHTPYVHLGRVGSANTVMKSGLERDRISIADEVTAFEMEGAGVWEQYPTIVIKGACDYADSHKNKRWQDYAAAMAAACLKIFLQEWIIPEQPFIQGSLRKPERNISFDSDSTFVNHDLTTRSRFGDVDEQPAQLDHQSGAPSRRSRTSTSAIVEIGSHHKSAYGSSVYRLDDRVNGMSTSGFMSATDFLPVREEPQTINIQPIQSQSNPTGEPVIEDELTWQDYFQPLGFDRSHDTNNTSRKTAGTCEWLITCPEYKHWLQRSGVLLVRGHPGCGKSTLLRFALAEQGAQDDSESLVLSFFFQSRGAEPETSMHGMLQSLLFQLLTEDEESREPFCELCRGMFETRAGDSDGPNWNLHNIQATVEKLLLTCSARRDARLFIDAIDECRDQDREKVIQFFHSLQITVRAGLQKMGLFMTSRSYPDSQIVADFTIQVEERSRDDIRTFLENELRLPDETQEVQDDMKSFLQNEANGSFLWLVLIIPRIHELGSKGLNMSVVKSEISRCPQQLDELYETLLGDIDSNEVPEVSALFQWICFAIRPISVDELRLALTIHASGGPLSIKDYIDENNSNYISNEQKLRKRVTYLSRGLVEFSSASILDDTTDSSLDFILNRTSDGTSERTTVIRFYHDSIKNFMITKGLAIIGLKTKHTHELVGKADAQLANTCLWFLSAPEIRIAMLDDDVKYLNEFSFYRYARDCWLSHAVEAERNGMSNIVDWACHNALPAWIRATKHSPKAEFWSYTEQTQPIHIAAGHGLTGLAIELLGDNRSTGGNAKTKTAVEGGVSLRLRSAFSKTQSSVHNSTSETKPLSVRHSTGKNTSLIKKEKSSIETPSRQLVIAANNRSKGRNFTNKSIVPPRGKRAQQDARPTSARQKPETLDDLVNARDSRDATPIWWAAHAGQLVMIELLLEYGANIHLRSRSNETPLHRASGRGCFEVVKYLLERGASIDIQTCASDGTTPLYAASSFGNLDVVRYLMEHGAKADVCVADDRGWTPVHIASDHGHLDVVKYLMKHGADIHICNLEGATPLHAASQRGYLKIVEYLHEHGADNYMHIPDLYGRTPLYVAAAFGHLGVVKFLLNHGGNIKSSCNPGWSLIHEASNSGHLDVLRYLLEHGVESDLYAADTNGIIPLHTATLANHLEVVKFLVDHEPGCDVHVPNKLGWTALHMASLAGNLEMVKYLFEHGADADIHAVTNQGWTPLFAASRNGCAMVVKYLLEHGAHTDICISNDEEFTPLTAASGNGFLEVIKLLAVHRADYHTSAKNRRTPIYYASAYGRLEVVKYLIEFGPEKHINYSDSNGETPLYVASIHGHVGVVSYLLEHGAGASIHNTTDAGYTPLLGASDFGLLEVVKCLCEHGAITDLHVELEDGATALCVASQNGHLAVVEYLLDNGADSDIDIHDHMGNTPLFLASINDHFLVARLFIERGANVHFSNCSGLTALHAASIKGDTALVECLLEYGANIDTTGLFGITPLHKASAHGSLQTVTCLVDHGADIHVIDFQGYTPLENACFYGHIEVVHYLMRKGANIHTLDSHGCTPLFIALRNGQLDVAKHMIELGADKDVYTQDKFGCTPLSAASANGELEVVEFLLEHYNEGGTYLSIGTPPPLCAASSAGYTQIIRCLLNSGADKNHSGLDGSTPLICAIKRGHKAASRLLIGASADPMCMDNYGRTAVDWLKLQKTDDDLLRAICSDPQSPPRLNLDRLHATISSVSAKILSQEFKNATILFFQLGHCHMVLNDDKHALLAYQQRATPFVHNELLKYILWCEICEAKSIVGSHFICKTCLEIVICELCVDPYRKKECLPECVEHEFLEVPVPNPADLHSEDVKKWLQDNVERYKPSQLMIASEPYSQG